MNVMDRVIVCATRQESGALIMHGLQRCAVCDAETKPRFHGETVICPTCRLRAEASA